MRRKLILDIIPHLVATQVGTKTQINLRTKATSIIFSIKELARARNYYNCATDKLNWKRDCLGEAK